MQEINLSEKQVDELILSLITSHSKEVQVDESKFLDLLKFSLSLNTMEKKRVVDAVPTLSQFQFDELSKVFTEERDKFRELAKEHPEDIKKLVAKQQKEWLELGDLYQAEMQAKQKESQDQNKIDDIKASLGL
ncbi:MAG: hypothetical protein PHI37_05750 [Candidatus Gracilibacteria bacterium]|nr:hypothetical protein [Candidatus Gracilibacteria bacterium]